MRNFHRSDYLLLVQDPRTETLAFSKIPGDPVNHRFDLQPDIRTPNLSNMDEYRASVRKEKINDSNFYVWERLIQQLIKLRDVDQPISNEAT